MMKNDSLSRFSSSLCRMFIVLILIGLSYGVSFSQTTGTDPSYQYDEAGRLTAVSYDDLNKIEYVYDKAGNLLSVKTTSSQSTPTEAPTATPDLTPTPIPTATLEPTPTDTPTEITVPTETPTPTIIPTVASNYDDLVVAQGFGGETLVNIRYYNLDNQAYSSIRRSFSGIPLPFLEQIGGGQGRATYLASGDLNGDGIQDIVTSFGPITENSDYPNLVVIRDSQTKKVIGHSFVAFPSGEESSVQYNGGEIRATVGQFTGSNLLQLAVAQGSGGNGIVRIYQFTNNPPPNSWEAIAQFNGLPEGLIQQTATANGEISEATKISIGMTLASGDLDRDGQDELVIGQTNGPQSQTIFHVLDLNSQGGVVKRSIYAGFKTKFRGNGGIEVQVADLNGDLFPEIIVGSMGNLQNFNDERDTVPLNLIGIISPIIENQAIIGFSRPSGKSVSNVFTEEINPSGAVTLAAGEFDGDPMNGKEIAVGTSAWMEMSGKTVSFQLPPSEPRYKILKIQFDGQSVTEIKTLGPTNGYVAFVGGAVPTSKTVFLTNLKTPIHQDEN